MKTNILIAQSGGPSMVINQSLAGAVMTARKTKGFGAILGAKHGVEGVLREDFIDLGGIPAKTLEAVAATPSSALGSVRRKPSGEDCARIVGVLAKNEIGAFFYIGGNDSADAALIVDGAARAAGFPLKCIHIPKTIDNDLLENDHTPGYGSAARFVAMAFMGDNLDNLALGGVKINVVMGRHAGFLTAASALARRAPDDGPHLIYLPERPFTMERFTADVDAVMRRTGRCVIAVSEGVCGADGKPVAAAFGGGEKDSHGNVQLSGTGALGDMLATGVKSALGVKRVRADTFGYLQRSFPGVASESDSMEAFGAGAAAALAAAADDAGSGSVALVRAPGKYAVSYKMAALADVAKRTRSMPDEFIAEGAADVTAEFIAYAAPLAGALPAIARLF